jgi:hypothetical protein
MPHKDCQAFLQCVLPSLRVFADRLSDSSFGSIVGNAGKDHTPFKLFTSAIF